MEQIADQLCHTVGGRFDLLVSIDGEDDTAEKLQMLVNFVLASARRSIDEVSRVKDALARELEERQRAERECEILRQEVRGTRAQGGLVGDSPALAKVRQQIEVVAPTDANVLILGESGTGKELVAREIHRASRRRHARLVKVNCASIPRELFESEFFGHVKGAFTGAVRNRLGRFELAGGGTLFLDEVGEIPLELQGKLLRVLQEGEFERIGEERTRRADVRILAATNRPLEKEVEERRFRQDLYYRLNVFPIHVAPLRERGDDVARLAAYFLERLAREMNRPVPKLLPAQLAELRHHAWPGNVRELRNVVEYALITWRGGPIRFELPAADRLAPDTIHPLDDEVIPEAEMKRRERRNLLAALRRTGWKVYGPGGAAELLGLKPNTLAARMKKFGLTSPRRRHGARHPEG